MDIEEFRKAGYAAIDQICDYYQSLNERPVKSEVKPGYLLEQLPISPPAKGQPFNEIAADFQARIMPGITHWQHQKWFGYFPSVVTFESILGDLYSSSVTNPGFNWSCSPACTELEQVVTDWMVEVLGLDPVFRTSGGKGGGIIGNSASESCLTAAIAARERALRYLASQESKTLNGLGHDGAAGHVTQSGTATPQTAGGPTAVPLSVREKHTKNLVMYVSTQTHSVGSKAALILGMQCRALPVHAPDYSFRGDVLRKAIEEDVKNGYIPFFVVGTVGSTSSGAVDHIAELGEVVKDYPTAFLHVDAAWAGVAYALPEQRKPLRLDEVNKYADSFCTNMHKWGLVGFDCSLFFVRDRRDLTEALDITPAYLRTKEGDSGAVIDYRNWQLALGRRFRSIKLWFVLRGYGVEGLQAHLRNGIEYCEQLTELVKRNSSFEIVAPPILGLLDFRLVTDRKVEDSELNALNAELMDRLNSRPEVMLTQTVLKSIESEVYCIRFAIGAQKTTWADVEEIWNVVEQEGAKLLGEWKQKQVAN